MRRCFAVVEGHGEVEAVGNLLSRLSLDLGETGLTWMRPKRGRQLDRESGVRKHCERIRREADASALLLLRDEDDGCPKELAPHQAELVESLGLPFPVAVVLATREYESLFLASLESIAGHPFGGPGGLERPGLRPDAAFEGDPSSVRGAKERLSQLMSGGRRYKPTLDQLPMTQRVDFEVVRRRGLNWFGTLERALRFLARGQAGEVYPAPETAVPPGP